MIEQRNRLWWQPEFPVGEPIISLENSPGGRARALWAEKFTGFEERVLESSEMLATDIGGGFASEPIKWGSNGAAGVRVYGDGLQTPPHEDLRERFGYVPDVLFLAASTRTPDNIYGLRGIVRKYREQGVKIIIGFLGSVAHEREDQEFKDQNGGLIRHPVMLRESIEDLARCLDGGCGYQLHSKYAIDMALDLGFPLLPIDGLNDLVHESGIRDLRRACMVSVDKGRNSVARELAAYLGWPLILCDKSRRRLTSGAAKVTIHDPVALEFIRENGYTAVVPDDEIREGTTTAGARILFDGYADDLVIMVIKGIFARSEKYTAAQLLALPLRHGYRSERIIVTDAVRPVDPVDEIAHKLEVVHLRPKVERFWEYLKNNFTPNGDPEWLRNPDQLGSHLRLDLAMD